MRPKDSVVRAGIDLAFRHDHSTLVVAYAHEDRIVVNHVQEWAPGRNAPLRPSTILTEIVGICRRMGVETIAGDTHGRDTAIEYVVGAGMGWLDTPARNDESYVLLRFLLREGRIRLPYHERLRQQLIDTNVRYESGGTLKVSHKRTSDGHGDLVPALVGCVWSFRNDVSNVSGRVIGSGNLDEAPDSDPEWASPPALSTHSGTIRRFSR